MSKRLELTGQQFGRLTAVKCIGRDKWNLALWLCRCECGNQTTVSSHRLRQGSTQSCGCLQKETRIANGQANAQAMGKNNKTHGHGNPWTPTYRSWRSMKLRCTNPNATGYLRYGGRGITVCERWLNSFEAFLEDLGTRPDRTSLGRIKGDLGYFPGNVEWQTNEQQCAERDARKMVAVC